MSEYSNSISSISNVCLCLHMIYSHADIVFFYKHLRFIYSIS